MKEILESGIKLSLPGPVFRLEECPGYKSIKSQNVTEMDVIWLQKAILPNDPDTLWMIELKRFYDPLNPLFKPVDISDTVTYSDYITTFTRNVWHTLSMISHNRSQIQEFATSVMDEFNFQQNRLKIAFIVNCPEHQLSILTSLNEDLKRNLKDAIAIFRIDNLAVIDYTSAKMFYPEWIG